MGAVVGPAYPGAALEAGVARGAAGGIRYLGGVRPQLCGEGAVLHLLGEQRRCEAGDVRQGLQRGRMCAGHVHAALWSRPAVPRELESGQGDEMVARSAAWGSAVRYGAKCHHFGARAQERSEGAGTMRV